MEFIQQKKKKEKEKKKKDSPLTSWKVTKVQLRLRFFEQEQWRRGGEKMHVSFNAYRRRNFEENLNTQSLTRN